MMEGIVRRAAGILAVLAAAGLVALLPATAAAQEGDIVGRVADAAGEPVRGATVTVVDTRFQALTGATGQFALTGVPAGVHTLRVSAFGYRTAEVADVRVQAGSPASVEVSLDVSPYQMGDIVVSASRQEERIVDAPATVTKIGAEDIQNSVGNSFNGALAEVKGLDFIQVGVTTAAVNARGFNSSFNNRMLMVEDGRIGVLPENGLPLGQFTAIPKVDLESVEVLVGPGAALYGADASNGVITLRTKDPKAYPGTTAELSGGSRDYLDFQFRHAGVTADGGWGYKVAGEHQQAQDFENRLTHDVGGEPVEEIGIDWHSSVHRVAGELVRYDGDNRFSFSTGYSQTDGVGQTNVGRNQLEDWTYNFQQLKLETPNVYASLYRTQSQSGDSYAINRFTTNRVLNPDMSEEEVRLMSDWPSDGQLYVADAQVNARIPELLNTRVTLGGQYRYDRVSSDEEWLTDVQTGEPLGVNQGGLYLQSETPISSRWKLILGGRFDDHEDYESQFSPKAGLLFKPAEDQSVRFTYNRAYKSPTTLQTRFFIWDFVPAVGVFGNREGFTVRDTEGNVLMDIDPLVPEENETIELGYRGVLGERFFLDATAYYSWYQDFLGSLLPVNNPFAETTPTLAHFADGSPIVNPDGVPQIVLTYQNLGAAEIWGTDIGARYAASPDVDLKGTLSLVETNEFEASASDPDATALNSTPVKWTLGADFDNVGGAGFGGVTVRHSTGYFFSSGINSARIPTFTTLNLQAGYRLPIEGTQVQLSVQNLFTCRTVEGVGDDVDPVDGTTGLSSKERSCGFDEGHVEMVNMPAQKMTVFFGLRVQR